MGPNGAKCVTSPMVPAAPLISSLGSHLPRAWEKVFILAQGGAGGVGGGRSADLLAWNSLLAVELAGAAPQALSLSLQEWGPRIRCLEKLKGVVMEGGQWWGSTGSVSQALEPGLLRQPVLWREMAQPAGISFFSAGSLLSLSRRNAERA